MERRGGKRANQGRKPGSLNKRTREIADRASKEGISPLEVMIEAMRDAYEKGGAIAAFAFAKDAAPYLHPRISAIEHSGPNGGAIENKQTLDNDQLEALALKMAVAGKQLDGEY
jgi:hypothetical protein